MNRVFYLAVFHEEDNRYWISFPDFPECFIEGNTIEESFINAQEALELCIEERISNNEKLPKPTLKIDDNSNNDKHILLYCEYNSSLVAA